MAEFVTLEKFEQLMEMNKTLAETVKTLVGGGGEKRVSAGEMSLVISKHHPSKFDGVSGPGKLEDWIRELEKIFETVKCPGDLKVEQAAFYLSGKADLWWHNQKGSLRELLARQGERLYWSDMKAALREEFFPSHQRREKEEEFERFVQGDLSVEMYYTKFMELYNYCTDRKTDASLALKFENGLHIDILERLTVGTLASVREVYLRAGQAERLVRMRREWDGKRKGGDSSSATSQLRKKVCVEGPRSEGFSYGNNMSVNSGFRPCRRCGVTHPKRTCDGKLITCFECGKPGHKASECFSLSSNSRYSAPSRFQGGRGNLGGQGRGFSGGSFSVGVSHGGRGLVRANVSGKPEGGALL